MRGRLRGMKCDLVQSYRRSLLRSKSPQRGELIYVPTHEVKLFVVGSDGRRKEAGHLSDPNWQPVVAPIHLFPKIQSCIDHWKHGVPWSCTFAYQRMLWQIQQKGVQDDCRNLRDVIERYERLDEIFEQVAREGQLRPAGSAFSSEHLRSGIILHFDRSAQPLFGLGGCHRLAMALVLDLPEIPALLGRVHPAAAKAIDRFRREVA